MIEPIGFRGNVQGRKILHVFSSDDMSEITINHEFVFHMDSEHLDHLRPRLIGALHRERAQVMLQRARAARNTAREVETCQQTNQG